MLEGCDIRERFPSTTLSGHLDSVFVTAYIVVLLGYTRWLIAPNMELAWQPKFEWHRDTRSVNTVHDRWNAHAIVVTNSKAKLGSKIDHLKTNIPNVRPMLSVRQYEPRDRVLLAGYAFGSALVIHTRCLTMLEAPVIISCCLPRQISPERMGVALIR